MTFAILLLLLAAALASRLLKWRTSSRALFILTAVVFFAVGCGPVPELMLRDLRAGFDPDAPARWTSRPVIVLLGGGSDYDTSRHEAVVPIFAFGRITKTLELYRSCRQSGAACRVLVSGGDPRHRGASEAAVYGNELIAMGVEAKDLILESRSGNTWQNAQFTRPLLKSNAADGVVLVTSAVHCRRSRLYFSHFGIDAVVVRGDYMGTAYSPLPSAYNFAITDTALHEYVGILRYHVYEWLGLNQR